MKDKCVQPETLGPQTSENFENGIANGVERQNTERNRLFFLVCVCKANAGGRKDEEERIKNKNENERRK